MGGRSERCLKREGAAACARYMVRDDKICGSALNVGCLAFVFMVRAVEVEQDSRRERGA